MTYECLNNCTIRVHLRAYRDCGGTTGIANTINFVPSVSGCAAPTPIGNWSAQVTTEVTPVCPTQTTNCSNGSFPGVEEYYWWRDYNICNAGNCSFTITWDGCCRNSNITSLSNAGSQNMYTGSTVLNTTLSTCNSSPQFTNPPVPYVCAGQSFTFNQGAYDPDGDSLSYALGPCYQGANQSVTYASGFSANAPLGPSWTVSIDPVTGDITLSPNPGNALVAVLCVYVYEWRNGQIIDNIVRDIQITVLACNNAPPTTTGLTNLSNGIINGPFEVTVCLGTNFTIDFPITDANTGDIVTAFWNSNISGASFYQTGNPSIQDTIVGTNPSVTLQWTPNAIGFYTFLVTMQDDACPLLGQNQFTIKVNVIGGLLGASAGWSSIGCTDVAFTANPGSAGTGPYTYLWNGTGNIPQNPNNTNQNMTHTFPSPGTYYTSVTISDNNGCFQVIPDTVVVTTGPTADAGPDVSICSGYSTPLGGPAISGQTYLWSPGTGLSSTTVSSPTFQQTVSGSPVTTVFTQTANDGFCTSMDYATVVVYPTPTASIVGTANICDGSSSTLTASGGTSFLWSTGDTTASITVSPAVSTTYSVTVIDNGCASAPALFTVNVSQGPTAIVSGTSDVCPGGNATLTVVGGTSWLWSTGSTNQTITLPNLQNNTTVFVVPSVGTCSGLPVSYTVNVYDAPSANFLNSTACYLQPTSFTDLSSDPNGLVTGWSWNFGDPNSGFQNQSTTKNSAHVYTAPGTYNATLIITSSNGCRDTVTKSVTVNSLPQPDFTFTNVCEGLQNSFTNTTPGIIQIYGWDFGDNASATTQNTAHTYANPGFYNVTLTVTDGNGCVNSKEKAVAVWPEPEADFTWTNKCFNSITEFQNTSTLNDPYGTTLDASSWNFGDPPSGVNNTSNIANPTHNYPVGYTYNVTLTVTSSRSCKNTVTIPVEVEAINPLVGVYDSVCLGFAGTPRVTNIPNGMTVEWYYTQDGTNPFNVGPKYNTPPLSNDMTYWVGMLDQWGCKSNKIPVYVEVLPYPGGNFVADQTQLEIPNAIAEFNYAQTNPNVDIVAYFWDFGDGTTSSSPNPVHQYTQQGEYTVTLTLIDENGCEYTFTQYEYITVDQRIRLYVPNAFTPNGDNVNDEFFVGHRLIENFEMMIMDRWGKVIYQTTNINFSWDGTDASGQKLPEGVYAYAIRATAYDGYKFEKSGTITLVR